MMKWALKGWKCVHIVVGAGVILAQPGCASARSLMNPPIINGLQAAEQGVVKRVIDGNSFVLASGLRVNLSGLLTPQLARPGGHAVDQPLAAASKDALAHLIYGQRVQLYYGGDTRDRYGRAQAQVYLLNAAGAPTLWVQNSMVSQGLARVYPWPKDRLDTQTLYASETKARDEKLGIWDVAQNGGVYDVRAPEPNALIQYVDSVQLVEGIVISSADVRGTQYLNFGADYKTDFTVAVAKTHRRSFKQAGVDLQALDGARVRVRGYIEIGNGPIIWLQTPARLEILN